MVLSFLKDLFKILFFFRKTCVKESLDGVYSKCLNYDPIGKLGLTLGIGGWDFFIGIYRR